MRTKRHPFEDEISDSFWMAGWMKCWIVCLRKEVQNRNHADSGEELSLFMAILAPSPMLSPKPLYFTCLALLKANGKEIRLFGGRVYGFRTVIGRIKAKCNDFFGNASKSTDSVDDIASDGYPEFGLDW